MRRRISLRLRLTAIILLPLLLIAVLIGVWAVIDTQNRAQARFNNGLLLAALAVSRDVAASSGDALSPGTSALLRDTSGGKVFYHVFAPDGVFVTGYATPPIPVTETIFDADGQQYFDGVHQSRLVHAIRFTDGMQIDGLSGNFTVTIWQDQDLLKKNIRDLLQRTLGVIGVLVLTVALIVWFGVRRGLGPLLDLEDAIARRSSGDLSAIKRAVPEETAGIVATLNRLFGQVSTAMAAQSEFIGNAAHQLRNPIAGVMSLAESVVSAPNADAAKSRAQDLLVAAEEAADLSKKLLLLERAGALTQISKFAQLDLSAALSTWADGYRDTLPKTVELKVITTAAAIPMVAEAVMLREAFANLIDNAIRHGGPKLTKIEILARQDGNHAVLQVRDNGRGIPQADIAKATTRFVQLTETSSTGLGLSIVEAIVTGHGGRIAFANEGGMFQVTMTFPQPQSAV